MAERLEEPRWCARKPEEEPPLILVCLICGSTMQDRGCKLRCPECHYFMSCSDFL